jgi:Tfp pilus assembly protein PilV
MRSPIQRPSPVPHRGVSLVEALVAMAVMAIGMLALVGVQGTMRLNSDLARQRTEATRIASDEIERLRSFISLTAVNDRPGESYEEIASRTLTDVQPPGSTANASYTVVRTVVPDPNSGQKVVSVQVSWADRTGVSQTVSLESSISAAEPTLTAMVIVPHRDSAISRGQGRHISIPAAAVPVRGDSSSSRFTPPGATGVTWYFNNLTGQMRVCTGDVNDVSTCPTATLVSGAVRYHISDEQPTGADAEHPAGPLLPLAAGPGALVLADAVGTGTSASCYGVLTIGTLIEYYCAVSTQDSAGWGGRLNLALASGTFSSLASGYKSCRYTADLPTTDVTSTPAVNEADPNAEFTVNANHPRKYCLERPLNPGETANACRGKRVKVNLINQNFLVIRGDQSCPSELNDDGTPNGQGLDALILANTRQHQPAP